MKSFLKENFFYKLVLLSSLGFIVLIPIETFAGKSSLPGSKGSTPSSSSSSSDTTAPDAPTSLTSTSAENDNTPTFTGTAEANSKVVGTLYSGSSVLGRISTTANNKGQFIITSPELQDGVYSVKATATDAAGNVSSKSSALSVTIDTTAPDAPTSLATSTTTTSDPTPTITGNAEANSKITLFIDSTSLGTTTADTKGAFSFTPSSAISDGTYSIKATATDAAGNVSSKSSALSITIDTTAPDAPTSLTNISDDDDPTPTISGTAEANSKVTLFIDSSTLGTTTADSKGAFSFTPSSAISDGTYSIKASATDSAGNVSSKSSSLSLTVDTTAPDAPSSLVITPSSITNDTTPTISGTAEPNSNITIEIYSGSTILGTRTLTADNNGDFSYTQPSTDPIPEGEYTLKLDATDSAGNTSSESSISFTIDTTAPSTPTSLTQISDKDDSNPTISGKAEANSKVTLFIDSSTLGTTTADTKGAFSFTPSSAISDGTYSIKASATDSAGNVSSKSSSLSP